MFTKRSIYIPVMAVVMTATTVITNAQNKNSFAVVENDPDVLRKSIEANPNDLALHQKYIKVTGVANPEIEKQYQYWIDAYPKLAIIPFALGEAYCNRELPSAKPYLLKAVQLDPKLAKAYYYLWIDAERWGDFVQSQNYLAQAKETDPDNPDYAFYYASSFSKTNSAKYRSLSLEVAKQFPASERGAQALYWLGNRFTDPKERINYFEQLKANFPPDKFSWSSSGMSSYFDLLLDLFPKKAVALAQSMINTMPKEDQKNEWKKQLEVAQNIVKAHLFISQNKPKDAVKILENTKVNRWSTSKTALLLLQAKALNASGKTSIAYDNLKLAFANSPENKINEALNTYGAKLGKSKKQIEGDVWYIRDTSSKQATDFSLKRYLSPGEISLSDLKGKVVLLTYWFPGCGPCRGEFPHFQNVVNKFKGQNLEYIGINISPEQNEYVVPFMKSSGYSFTPLEDVPERAKGNLDNRGAAPVNFLIDQEGRIMFKDFRTDVKNEDVLEEMIRSLLNRKTK